MPPPHEQDNIKALLGSIADFAAVADAITSDEENADHPISVLIVDDDFEAVLEMCECISETGVQCFTAANGAQALEIIVAEDGVDLIVTDLKMPGMDGLEFIQQLRDGPKRETEVIMVSGHGTMGDVRRAMHEDVREFLTKPIDCGELADTVRRIGDKILRRRADMDNSAIIQYLDSDETNYLEETLWTKALLNLR